MMNKFNGVIAILAGCCNLVLGILFLRKDFLCLGLILICSVYPWVRVGIEDIIKG